MINKEQIENLVKKLHTRKYKNIIYIVVAVFVVFCFAYRFYSVAKESNFNVFNVVRNNQQNGVPVNVLTLDKTDGILYEPITIKNNRAYVSGKRIGLFKVGQKIGNCKIVSVSKNIDLDTGMHVIKTSGCANGLQYVENVKRGFYVPVAAIYGNTVYVADGGVARAVTIEIENRDMQNALIKSGVKSGDVIILSNVQNNQKIQIAK